MSEFSESFHLKSDRQEEGVALLEKVSLKGYVLPPHNNWVSFVLEEYQYEQLNEDLIKANKGLLVHYTFSEDSDWTISVYKGSQRVMHYSCSWEDGIAINNEELNLDIVKDLAAVEVSEEELRDLFYPEDEDALFDSPPAYRIAEILGLRHYSWFGYNYVKDLIALGEIEGSELKNVIAVG